MESRVDIPLNKYVYIYILYSAFLLRKRVIKSAEAPNNNIECLFGKKERREFEGDRHGVDKDFSFSFHFFFGLPTRIFLLLCSSTYSLLAAFCYIFSCGRQHATHYILYVLVSLLFLSLFV